MAIRKINHSRRILSKKRTSVSKIGFSDIIEFKYNSDNTYDKKPMVFIDRLDFFGLKAFS